MIGKMLGWHHLESLFLGAMLSISSTSIIYKAFEEMKLKGKNSRKWFLESWSLVIEKQLLEPLQKLVLYFRFLIALLLLAGLLYQFMPILYVVLVLASASVSLALCYFLAKILQTIYVWLENHFLKQIDSHSSLHLSAYPVLAPWDAHLTAPSRDEVLMPFDRVTVIGNDEQLENLESYFTSHVQGIAEGKEDSIAYSLNNFLVQDNSQLLGKAISESGIREQTQGLVVGLERKGKRILNPDTHLKIQAGDLIWIVGN